MPAFEISVFPPCRGRTPIPRAGRSWRSRRRRSRRSGSVIAKAVITLPSAIGPSQRSFCACDPPSRIGVVPSPWRAKTASASGEASPSTSRIRQQARRSRSRIGWSQPPAPRSCEQRARLRPRAGIVRWLGAPGDLASREGPRTLGEVGVTRLEERADRSRVGHGLLEPRLALGAEGLVGLTEIRGAACSRPGPAPPTRSPRPGPSRPPR